MDVKFSNNGHSTLASSLTTSATSITVASGHGARFPSLSGSAYFFATLIDSSNNLEIVKVTARSTDVFTAARAQESTSARAFAAGDRVELRITAQGLTDATSTVADNAVTLAKMAAGTDGNIISYDASGDPVAVATGSAGQVLTSAGAGAPPTFATATVPDNAITLAKMASGTDGNIISYDASGNPVAVATGSSGQVLTSAGAGAPPTFSAAAGGSSTAVALTGTTDEVDWGAGDIFTHTLTADTTYTFANVPTAGAVDMIFTNRKEGYNIDVNSVGETFDPTSTIAAALRGGWVKLDGTKFYMKSLESDSQYHIFQFAFGTPFDISTLSYESKTKDLNGTNNNPFYIGDDGDYIFFGNQDRTTTRHSLSTAYDISTVNLSTTQTLAASVFINAHARNDSDMAYRGIWFKPDGTVMYSGIRNLAATDGSQFNICYYTLSTPWDLSTASAVTANHVYLGNANHLSAFSLSPDGHYLVMNALVGDYSRVAFYKLLTPWIPASADIANVKFIDMNSYNTDTDNQHISFNSAGTAILMAEKTSDDVFRWELGNTDKFCVDFPAGVADARGSSISYLSEATPSGKSHMRLVTNNGAANVVITK